MGTSTGFGKHFAMPLHLPSSRNGALMAQNCCSLMPIAVISDPSSVRPRLDNGPWHCWIHSVGGSSAFIRLRRSSRFGPSAKSAVWSAGGKAGAICAQVMVSGSLISRVVLASTRAAAQSRHLSVTIRHSHCCVFGAHSSPAILQRKHPPRPRSVPQSSRSFLAGTFKGPHPRKPFTARYFVDELPRVPRSWRAASLLSSAASPPTCPL